MLFRFFLSKAELNMHLLATARHHDDYNIHRYCRNFWINTDASKNSRYSCNYASGKSLDHWCLRHPFRLLKPAL